MVLFAKDVVESDFISVPRSTNALEAAKLMSQRHHGFVVVSTDGKPEGIVTEWDYVSKIVAEAKDPASVRLEEIMSRELITVDANEGFDVVASKMAGQMIRRVLVTQNGNLLGIITARTILARMKEYVDKVTTMVARLQTPPF
jgi:CBS domain-containing protein